MSYQETDVIDFTFDKSTLKVGVKTYSSKNLLELANENVHFYNCYKELLQNDYMLYFHTKEVSYFSKRTNFDHIFKRNDLYKAGDLYYTLTPPSGSKINDLSQKRLLVIFSSIPMVKDWTNSVVTNRVFFQNFPEVARSLVKNVWIMRIMDFNLSFGSYYVNTVNYPTMEDDVQQSIVDVINKLSIEKEDVVLYGSSKGGAGALLHSARGNYQSVSVDPIISAEEYNKMEDRHFIKSLRTEDLTTKINQYLELHQDNKKKHIICCPAVKFNYTKVQGLKGLGSDINIIELEDEAIRNHTDVAKNCIPEQLVMMNRLFMKNNNERKMKNEK
ncbi:conserved hypothetical protein [Brochothrix thermosphacta]|uniref:XcbB/CpsF family capsular polysaccharide biosynthesis protein n=1 Tax=Brochothrix thermosphacta TaxID=2756 RepID=UPI000D0EABE3|nr:XcbB/CpsF family capsular polysaccharide biosynthesis protein [Brochothrix thermosphacta]SOC27789.1 conserved hypothetical protein [Brochothrix thermosphacta]